MSNEFTLIMIWLAAVFVLTSIISIWAGTSRLITAYLAMVAFVTIGSVAMAVAEETPPAPTTANAILALYVASDNAQRAIDYSICNKGNGKFKLTDEEARQFTHVARAVGIARVTDDNALITFCAEIGER